MTPSNWTLSSYTNSTWTDLVDASADTVLKTLAISTGANSANVQVRLASSGGSALHVLLPSSPVSASSSYVLEVPALTIKSGQKLQVWADAANVSFAAFGAS